MTARGPVRLSYGLSQAWNLAAEHTPAARRRREENRAALAATEVSGRIQGQAQGPVARLPYGVCSMDYNGCEVIASYNVLLTLGRPMPLADVAAWYERRGLFLAGRFGTHVEAIPRFFRAQGLSARALYASEARDPDAFDAAFAGAEAAVFSFWNSAARLRSGVHTVALSHGPEGRLSIDNLYGRDREPNRRVPSLRALTEAAGILPIVLITVSAPEAETPD